MTFDRKVTDGLRLKQFLGRMSRLWYPEAWGVEADHGNGERVGLGSRCGHLLGRLDADLEYPQKKKSTYRTCPIRGGCRRLGARRCVVRSRNDIWLAGVPLASCLA